jgi:2-haloacid dehalogenase
MTIKHIVFDWGDTLVRDLSFDGKMSEWSMVFIIPDIENALDGLQKDFQLYVGSNAGDSGVEDIEAALKKIGLLKYFNKVFSSEDLGYEKPQKRFFESIRLQLQTNSEEIIMIGNSCKKDIEGAAKDGWFTIWFNENKQSDKTCEVADAVIYHMSQLVELVNEINEINDI